MGCQCRRARFLPRSTMSFPREFVGVLACCVAALVAVDAEVFGRCDLARALKAKGIASRDIATWVCIGERLSSIDTETATDPDDDVDGTVYHGVFLISSKWWCDQGKRGCGVTCDQMKRTLESNIDCAKKVFTETKRSKKNGFKAWGAYEDCLEPQSYVRGCDGLDADPEGDELDLTVHRRSGFDAAEDEAADPSAAAPKPKPVQRQPPPRHSD